MRRTVTLSHAPARRRRRGFTLIEASLATVIVGVGILSMMQLFTACTQQNGNAVNMTTAGITSGQLVRGLRPGIPLHFWIVWEDKDRKLSKPSPVLTQTLVDNFKEK